MDELGTKRPIEYETGEIHECPNYQGGGSGGSYKKTSYPVKPTPKPAPQQQQQHQQQTSYSQNQGRFQEAHPDDEPSSEFQNRVAQNAIRDAQLEIALKASMGEFARQTESFKTEYDNRLSELRDMLTLQRDEFAFMKKSFYEYMQYNALERHTLRLIESLEKMIERMMKILPAEELGFKSADQLAREVHQESVKNVVEKEEGKN